MTGFARARRLLESGELTVSVRSVNHRSLDLRFYSPSEIEPFEAAMRALVSRKMTRGHVDIKLAFRRTADSHGAGLNRPLLEAYMSAYREAAEQYGLEAAPDLSAAFRVPGMLTEALEQELGPEFEKELLGVLAEAVDAVNAFREREGEELRDELRPRIGKISEVAKRIEELRAQATPQYQARLKERLTELIGAAGVEPSRLAQEASILADRSDVTEEVARLGIHAGQALKMLEEGGEVGKRLDFLAQEMQRETNTILSKTNGVGELGLEITDLGLEVKAEIEKIREQALNLE